jgi:Ca-activated chloride channel family protein
MMDLFSTGFATTSAFLLLPLLVGLLFYKYWARRRQTPSLQYSSLSLIKGMQGSMRSVLAYLPLGLKFFALVFVVVALARPQKADEKVKRNVEGIDIMIVLDISDSMLIEDMKPENRMEASKLVISNFIKGRTSDRIGLVVFAGEAYTRVPLTLDYPLLLDNVQKVKPSRNIKMGTAIGVALATGVGRMKESKAKSRVVIFLTDGENNSGTVDPETALQMAVDEKLKVYSIGMGKDGEAQLPVYIQDAFGNSIKQYRPIHSKVNEPLLKSFGEKTGGKFWRANTGRELDEVFKDIDSLERTKIDVEKYNRYTELFQSPLKIAVFFFLLSVILGRTVLRRNP